MFETSINIDKSSIKESIERILTIFDDSFDESNILQLASIAESLPENEKEMVALKVTYKSTEQELIYAVQNDSKSLHLFFFSDHEQLINNISDVYRDFCNEIGN